MLYNKIGRTLPLICILAPAIPGFSQSANQTLSNLTSPVAVNQVLLPQTDNILNFGSASRSWKDLYLDGSLYVNGNRSLSNGGNTNNFFAGTRAGNSTTGVANTFVGAYAGSLNTTGHDNTAIGYFPCIQTESRVKTRQWVHWLFSQTHQVITIQLLALAPCKAIFPDFIIQPWATRH